MLHLSSSRLLVRSARRLRLVTAMAVALSGAALGTIAVDEGIAVAAPTDGPNPGEAVIEVVQRNKDIDVGKESAHGEFVCPEDGVIVYRHHGTPGHKGDENEPTKYRCADVTLNGNKARVVSTEQTAEYDEDKYPSKDTIVCPAGQVMVGRYHLGDQTDRTYHVCGRLQVAGIDIVPTTTRISEEMQESGKDSGKYYSEFEAPAGTVFVGRWHGAGGGNKSDENGMTHYKYAELAVGGLPAPQGLTVDATHSTAALGWEAVENDLVAYTYEVRVGGASLDPVVQPGITLKDLAPGSRQDVEIRAALGGVVSPPLSGWFQTSPPPQPTKPRNLRIDNAKGVEATVSWDAPANPATTQKYQVVVNGEQVGETPTRTHRITGLTIGSEYQVEIRARGPWIDSEPLAGAFVATAPPVAPGAPHSLVVTDPDVDKVTLEWSEPAETGGAPISEYSIKIDDAEVVMTDERTHRIAGLSTGTHSVEVRARNIAGFSEPMATTFDTLPTVPVLTGAEQVDGTTDVVVTWDPTDDITHSVQVLRDGEIVADAIPATETTATIGDNEYNTTYSYTVRAVGSSGYSESAPIEATPVANAFEDRPLDTVTLNRKKPVNVRVAFESVVGTVTDLSGKVVFQVPVGLEFDPTQTSVVGAYRLPGTTKWTKEDALALTDPVIGPAKRKLTATFDAAAEVPVGAQVSWIPKVGVAAGQEPGLMAMTYKVTDGATNLGPSNVSGSAAVEVPGFPAPAAPVITGVEQSGSSALVHWGGDLTYVDQFQVFRDGVLLRDKLDPTSTSVEITPHEPGREYRFTVVASGPGGTARSADERLVPTAPDEAPGAAAGGGTGTDAAERSESPASSAGSGRTSGRWSGTADGSGHSAGSGAAPSVTVEPATPDANVTVNPTAGMTDGEDGSLPVYIPLALGGGLAAVLGGCSLLAFRRFRLG